jgi:transketolase
MRTTLIRTLTEAAAENPRISLVVGDLGFGVVTDFARRFPEQFLNAGVAEQNMTGIAAGIGPVYLRLGRDKEPIIHKAPIAWEVGKAIVVREGGDATLISTGAMLADAVEAADLLAKDGISVQVFRMHTVKPLDADAVLSAARKTGKIIAIEEHSILGGLGGAVAEVLCEAGIPGVRFHRMGLPSEFLKNVGNQEYLRKIQGLDAPSLYCRIWEYLG